MSCNCKNKIKKMEAYSEVEVSKEEKRKLNPFTKILQILLQLCFGIFCGVVIIIMIVPMLVYIIGCLITGRQATFKIRNFLKKKK